MTKKMDLFLQNKYSKCYFRIIEKAKSRKLDNIYVEEHHILPKSLGGNNSTENLVLLTAREHFVCHLLLVKSVLPDYKKKMNYAFWRMCNGSKNRYKPTARFYAMGKQAFVESQTGHPSYLLSQSTKSRNKIGVSMSATLSKLTDAEMKERMLNSCCNPSVYTKERGDKISKSRTGYKDTQEAKDNKSLAAQKRTNTHLLESAAKRKGKTWKNINGKRTWCDKETLV
jgi:hypothetical protein